MQTANKIAINTIMQYTRLILNLVISLYSVRLILNALGPDDYGIYDVVAGVIAFMGFIEASLSQTSIRYISVSLGVNKLSEIRKSINTCLWLHIIIALLTFVLLEMLGAFLFRGFLNIGEERLYAAQLVFHSMCVSAFFQIAGTPIIALLTSHENFIFLSIITILNSLSKLAIAFILVYTSFDKLILYGALMALVVILNTLIYFIYAKHKYFQEICISKVSVEQLKNQVSFAGWTLLDVLGSIFNRQGYAIMLNKFFGTQTNAVFAISRQIEGQIYGVSAAVIDTMKPQIIKSYGQGNIDRMFRLSFTAGKFGFSLMSFVCIPLVAMMPEVLSLWLSTVPTGTVVFARIMVLACMSEQITRGLVYANQATGKIKWFSIIVSSIRALALPASIILCLYGCESTVTILVFLLFESLGSLSRILVVSRVNGLNPYSFIGDVLLRIILPFSIAFVFCILIHLNFSTILAMIINSIMTCIIYAISVYIIGLSIDEKIVIKNYFTLLKNKLC